MKNEKDGYELSHEVKSGSKILTLLGIVAILLGILAMLAPGIAGLSIVVLLGVFVTCAGVVRMFWALQASSLSKGLLTFALGSLTLICGIVLLANPIIGAGVLTIALGAYFILDGLIELAAGFTLKGGIWLVFGGGISVLLGIMIWTQYPLSGAWAMGTLLGIKLFMVGLITINGGSAVRSFAKA
jgi:uncharacterized membrane protein HdeD (DUF308 family)